MNTCEGCELTLSAGSAHVNSDGCIAALKEALAEAKKCATCQQPVPTVIHPGCIPVEVARRGGKIATDAAQKKIMEGIARIFSGDEEQKDERPRGGPKRWKP